MEISQEPAMIPQSRWKKLGIVDYKVFPTNTSDYKWHIILCHNISKARNAKELIDAWMEKYDGDDSDEGLCTWDSKYTGIFIFISFPFDASVVAHEAFHATRALYDFLNLPLAVESNEVYAYTLQKIVSLTNGMIENSKKPV